MQLQKPRIAIVSKFSPSGGVSNITVQLANELTLHGIQTDILVVAGQSPYPERLSSRVSIHSWNRKHVYSSIFSLFHYIVTHKPDAILAIRHKAINLSLLVHRIAPYHNKRRLILRLSGHVSSSISGKSSWQRWKHLFPLRRLYDKADAIIAVSNGVAEDFIRINPRARPKVASVPNPTIPREIQKLANEPLAHPWLSPERDHSVILGVGRFTRRKDFATLIKAFAEVRTHIPCRLILLGEGAERSRYLQVAEDLNIAQHMDLPGDVENPYAYMSRADLFVLSSYASEGSPNALKEALALGLPVVSTDCPSGPREILANGAYGSLVPPHDPERLAEAMLETLNDPPGPERLQAAVSEYYVETSAQKYLNILLPDRK